MAEIQKEAEEERKRLGKLSVFIAAQDTQRIYQMPIGYPARTFKYVCQIAILIGSELFENSESHLKMSSKKANYFCCISSKDGNAV